MKYKIKPYDELNDVYLLYRQIWWIFYSFVGVGSKQKLQAFIAEKGGIVVNL